MMNIMTDIANVYADAYTRTAEWITTHPVLTVVSMAASLAFIVVMAIVSFKSLMKLY